MSESILRRWRAVQRQRNSGWEVSIPFDQHERALYLDMIGEIWQQQQRTNELLDQIARALNAETDDGK